MGTRWVWEANGLLEGLRLLAMNVALSPDHRPWAARHRKRVLGPVVGLVAMAALVLVVVGLVVLGAGPEAAALGTFFAMLPVIPAVLVFLWIDRWEPEPSRMLLAAFLWGAGVAAVASAVTSLLLDYAWVKTVGPASSGLLGMVLTAPVVEELFKGLFLLLLLWFRRREFDGLVDGIVYAGLVGVGFAFTENILYLGSAFVEDGLSGAIHLFVLRCVLSPFAHPTFTAITGLAVGFAARSNSKIALVVLPCLGYLGAVLLHALWNGSAILANSFWFIYVVVMLPVLAALAAMVLWSRHREQRIVATQLPQFVAAGWIAPEEVRLLVSLTGRRGWRAAVNRQCGKDAGRAVGYYHTAVTELAFLRDRFAHGAVGPDAPGWHDDLVRTMLAARSRALSYSQALTAAARL